ncbi:adenylate/guanylate cyclase domain-containing protein [Mycolicibacterium moriokaense]|uniref:Class 3 adenylate cyclase n=1 Tax=Mycolicibacterium moriokaense TaxID=39691 RepID=A0A318HQ72_9MYCO|nr:adenylate/guanylate cyclase domain-containing protein [Mycolicibacterium moriokaense]PXX10949.1 class 3 adenylate cyclase [Mycolicibacterium moriokaense]
MFEAPETRYAKSGDVNIAYQVAGDGPFDLVHVPPFVSNLELQWEDPAERRYFERLASFSRLVMFDKRGTGLSDRVEVATLEERMDDLRAVMDAAGSERAAIYGGSEGGAMSILFTATYPDRVSALVLYGAYPRMAWAPDYPDGVPDEVVDYGLGHLEEHWGRGLEGGIPVWALTPDRVDDPARRKAHGKWERLSASPGAAVALQKMVFEIDVRHLLSAIRVPTLVVYRTADVMHAAGSRYLGAHIPGAKVVELQGSDYFPHLGDQDAILDEIEEFLTGVRPVPALDRALATVLFTDIVSSTERAAALGDDAWTRTLDQHDVLVAHEVERHRGRRINTTGDGMLATFDGPARAVRCAQAICKEVRSLGIEVRAGLHTGEIELRGVDIGGIAVHIGARVSALAGPSEILVSSTVKDLVAGSGISFADRGAHALKGVPGQWRVFAVES